MTIMKAREAAALFSSRLQELRSNSGRGRDAQDVGKTWLDFERGWMCECEGQVARREVLPITVARREEILA